MAEPVHPTTIRESAFYAEDVLNDKENWDKTTRKTVTINGPQFIDIAKSLIYLAEGDNTTLAAPQAEVGVLESELADLRLYSTGLEGTINDLEDTVSELNARLRENQAEPTEDEDSRRELTRLEDQKTTLLEAIDHFLQVYNSRPFYVAPGTDVPLQTEVIDLGEVAKRTRSQDQTIRENKAKA